MTPEEREKKAAYMREYNKRPEVAKKKLERDRSYYEKKKAEILAQQKEYVARKRAADPEAYLAHRNEIAARHRANPENTVKLRYLKARYGLTVEQYEQMVVDQQGLCKICGKPPNGRYNRLHVDHDHVTDRVRGLLCFRCNVMLGHATDNPGILQKGIEYLAEHLDTSASAV